jgi:TolB-like protein
MRSFFAFIILVSFFSIYAEKNEQVKILVQKIEAVDVDESLANSLEESIVLDIGNRENVSVVTSAELQNVVNTAALKSEMGCDESDECLIEVQNKLDVETLVAGKVTKLGDEFILSINTVNVATKSIGNRVSIEGNNLSELKEKIKGAVDILLGIAVAEQMFKLAEGEELNLAVMPLAARGMEQAAADSLTSILSAQLNQISGISVISQDDIKAMLSQASMASEMGCLDSLECVVEIGASLGLSKLVTGAVGKVTDSYVVSVQLIDVRKAEVDNRVLESFAGDERELQNAIKLAAYQLVGVDYLSLKGGVDFSFNIKKGMAQFGESETPFEDSKFELQDLTPGRYFLRIRADNDKYLPLQTDVYVAPLSKNVKTFNIMEKPTPWFKSWWFWTITGVVVIGGAGAVTAVVLTQQTPSGGGTVDFE